MIGFKSPLVASLYSEAEAEFVRKNMIMKNKYSSLESRFFIESEDGSTITQRKEQRKMNHIDTEAVRELELYTENTSKLYFGYTVPIVRSLHRKYEKGLFDQELAAKAFEPILREAAKMYAREFANENEWNRIFSAQTRKETAKELVGYYMENIIKGDL